MIKLRDPYWRLAVFPKTLNCNVKKWRRTSHVASWQSLHVLANTWHSFTNAASSFYKSAVQKKKSSWILVELICCKADNTEKLWFLWKNAAKPVTRKQYFFCDGSIVVLIRTFFVVHLFFFFFTVRFSIF